ncbi:hypothetical protein ACX27_18770 [Nostoc piscinale CENA21]|uniref:Uncharacterized protein n=1 Tax=Nostoc piscinale CENA21 TaxID=224013 RepID=A0A0M4SYQ0_9NOSO|nr:hypothetical protein ACX27_18770 [Nostoc piscinale CENA21]
MTENLTTGFILEPSEPDLNLGIKQPLLPHRPLGRKFISPKFLSPLGVKSLSNFDPSIFFKFSNYRFLYNRNFISRFTFFFLNLNHKISINQIITKDTK